MSRFEMNPETQQILDFLLTKPEQFTYRELTNITGINDVGRLRGYLMTGLRRLRKLGIWYRSVRGVGYRLIVEDEKNEVQSLGLTKVRRGVKRIDRDQDHINFDILSRDGKLLHTFNVARIGLMLQATSRKTTKEIKWKIANADLPIPHKPRGKTDGD